MQIEELSAAHARNLIKNIYKHHGFVFEEERLGSSIAREIGIHVEQSKYACLFCLLDEIIGVYNWLNVSMIASIANRPEYAGFQFRFLNSAKNSLSSVRLLLTNGFDHEARIQLRFLRELMVAWVYFDANPLTQIDFKKPENFQEANHFWYQHLRRAEQELKKLNAGTDAFHPHMDQKLIDIEKVLDAAAHPTWVGIDVSATSHFHSDNDTIALQNVKQTSLFSLSTAITLSIFGLAPAKPIDFAIPNGLQLPFPRHLSLKEPDEIMRELQKVPAALFLFACMFAEKLSARDGGPNPKQQSE